VLEDINPLAARVHTIGTGRGAGSSPIFAFIAPQEYRSKALRVDEGRRTDLGQRDSVLLSNLWGKTG
jgi:hypothetical protein